MTRWHHIQGILGLTFNSYRFGKNRLTQALRQLRELIDVLTSIAAVRDTEAEVKVEALQQVITEIVPLNHAEVV